MGHATNFSGLKRELIAHTVTANQRFYCIQALILVIYFTPFPCFSDSYNTNVHIPNKKGDTCMNLAIQSGKEEVVSFLLSCHPVTGSGDNSELLPLLVQAITAGNIMNLVWLRH